MGRIIVPLMVILSFLSSCSNSEKVNTLNDGELLKVLALSNIIDLNKIDSGIEKELMLRVFEVPVMEQNDCFPESHGVCAHDYYISVSQRDENPEYNVFKIGRLGQVVSYKWIEEHKPDHAKIEVLAYNYSSTALKYNPELKAVKKRILLKISVKGIIKN